MSIKRIVLASSSPRRKEILERFGIKFDMVPSDIDEKVESYTSSGDYVEQLAAQKGESVRDKLAGMGEDLSETLIISCDTIVVHDGKIIGKPADEKDAKKTLRELSSSWHVVYSGLSLILGDKKVSGYDETWVAFSDVSDEDIDRYIATGEPMGKAGSYAIQGQASAFVTGIDGDYTNIMGFPLTRFCECLKNEFGMSIFDLGEI